ncbi:MAG TPA: hypothetical protein VGL91_13540 [Acidobacteriota bacterium]
MTSTRTPVASSASSANADWRIYTSVFLIFFVASLVMTWPVAFQAWSNIPSNPGDPLLCVWMQMWVYRAITHFKILSFFDANIFFPASKTLALSEHLLADQVLFAPAYALTANPVFAYNVVWFFSFVLSGVAMFALAYYWTRSYGPSMVAGFIYAFFPTRFSQSGHIQLLSIYWAPLALLFLDRYLRNRKWSDLSMTAGCAVMQIWAGFYAGYFLLMIIFLYYGGYHLWEQIRPQRKDIILILLIAVLVFPLTYPYLVIKNRFGFERGLPEILAFSADLGKSFLSVPPENALYGERFRRFDANLGYLEKRLFFGFLPMALVLTALLRRRRDDGFLYLAYGSILVFAIVLSLGPSLVWFEKIKFTPLPYRILYELLPGFSAMRVPARVMLLGMVPVAIFAALAVKSMGKKQWISLLVLAGLFLEYRVKLVPMAHVPVGAEVPPVYNWLAKSDRTGGVLELPAGNLPYGECLYVYFSAYHFKPMVNGFSGYLPGYYFEILSELNRPVSNQTLTYLKAIGVDTLVLHRNLLDPKPWDQLAQQGKMAELARFGDDQVFSVQVNPEASGVAVGDLQLDYLWPDTEVESGLTLKSLGEIWRNPSHDGAVKVRANWTDGAYRFDTQTLLLLPLAVEGERWVGLKLNSPPRSGTYTVDIAAADNLKVRHRVTVLAPGQNALDGQMIDLRNQPVRLTASNREDQAPYSLDGNLATRWSTEALQAAGMYFQIGLPHEIKTSGIRLLVGADMKNYPRGPRIFSSADGEHWSEIANTRIAITVDTKPPQSWGSLFQWGSQRHGGDLTGANGATILWPEMSTRNLRIELSGFDPDFWWSISEFSLLH